MMGGIFYTYGFVVQIPLGYEQTYINWLPYIVDNLAKDKETLRWVDGKLSMPGITEKFSKPIFERVLSLLQSRRMKTGILSSGLEGKRYSAMFLLKP